VRLAAALMLRCAPDADDHRGVIVSTASMAAFEGQIGQVPYSAATGGVASMGLATARDLSPSAVRVVAITPGTIFTPAFRLSEDGAQSRWGGTVPFPKRMGRAIEYAALVEHLCDNNYLNSETVRVDGALRFGPP